MSFLQFLSDHPAESWMLFTAFVSLVHQYVEPKLPLVARAIKFATSMGIDLPKFYALLRTEFPRLPALPFLAALIVMGGCAGPLETSVRVVDASHDAIKVAHDGIDEAERDEIAQAVKLATTEVAAKQAVAAIEARYATVWARYTDVVLSWTAARASVASLETQNADNGFEPNPLTLLPTLGTLASAWTALEQQISAADIHAKGK